MTVQNQQYRQGTAQATAPAVEKSEFEKLLDRDFKMSSEFVPFLGKDPIKLSPGIVIKYLCKPTKDGHVCTEEQAIRFIMLCKARGLNPWEGDAYVVGYDTKNGPEFNLITAIQAFLKRAEVHPEYDGMASGVVVIHNETEEIRDIEGDYIPEDCRLAGGWARVYFKNRKIPIYRRLDLKVFDKGFSVWNSNKAGMIAKCAEADALRSAFPNSLGGMYMEDEMPSSEPAATTIPTPRTRLDAVKNAAQATSTPKVEPPAATGPADNTAPGEAGSPSEASAAPVVSAQGATESASPGPAADGTPTWVDLAKLDIVPLKEDDGITVQSGKNGHTLTPQGTFSADYNGYTVQPNNDEQDLLARQMAAKAVAVKAAPARKSNRPNSNN